MLWLQSDVCNARHGLVFCAWQQGDDKSLHLPKTCIPHLSPDPDPDPDPWPAAAAVPCVVQGCGCRCRPDCVWPQVELPATSACSCAGEGRGPDAGGDPPATGTGKPLLGTSRRPG
jgi:hypothetical protein